MAFSTAEHCFRENIQLVTPPDNELNRMLAFNLNQGLANLSHAVASQLAALQRQVADLEQDVKRLRRG